MLMENRDYTNLDYIDKVSYCFPTLIFCTNSKAQ